MTRSDLMRAKFAGVFRVQVNCEIADILLWYVDSDVYDAAYYVAISGYDRYRYQRKLKNLRACSGVGFPRDRGRPSQDGRCVVPITLARHRQSLGCLLAQKGSLWPLKFAQVRDYHDRRAGRRGQSVHRGHRAGGMLCLLEQETALGWVLLHCRRSAKDSLRACSRFEDSRPD